MLYHHDAGLFAVTFRGESVVCDSREDARAVTAAAQVFARQSAGDYTPCEIEWIAEVLHRHGRHFAAESLLRLALKMRALQFLSDTVGYERPQQTHPRVDARLFAPTDAATMTDPPGGRGPGKDEALKLGQRDWLDGHWVRAAHQKLLQADEAYSDDPQGKDCCEKLNIDFTARRWL